MPDARKIWAFANSRCGRAVEGYGRASGVACNRSRVSYVLQSVNIADVVDVVPCLAVIVRGCYGCRGVCASHTEIDATIIINRKRGIACAWRCVNRRIVNRVNAPGRSVIFGNDDSAFAVAVVVRNIDCAIWSDLHVPVYAYALSEDVHRNGWSECDTAVI